MKKILAMLVILFATGCTNQAIEGDQVGIYVDKPLIFGSGGVRKDIHLAGRAITWLTTDVVVLSTAPQSITVHVNDMMTSNKVPLDFDIAVTIEMDGPDAGPDLIKKFNGGPVVAFSRTMMPDLKFDTMSAKNPSGEFMSALRDQVRQRNMDAFLIAMDVAGKPVDANKEIEEAMVVYANNFMKKEGVPVHVRNVALGRANPPDEVKSALSRTAEQIQLKTTEGAREQAQIARKRAEQASADADHAQQLKLGFTNEQYLTKLYLETVLKVCGNSSKDLSDNKGGANCTMIVGQAMPTVPIR